ncbi:MAG: MotA/TolQ/ExbB proton channel family protein [Sulfurimonas sp.]|nr:MotA/TolQ/ExbB proton channel family protein [Sulfurimonas sp.]
MHDLTKYIEQGGVIVYILIALNILGFTIIIFKYIQIKIFKYSSAKVEESTLSLAGSGDDALILQMLKDDIKECIIKLESGLGIIKSIASISPLLGLLGTVIGVLLAFEAISQQGMDDPTIFAGSISMALITTIAGLIVAIPHYIGYNALISMLDRLEASLNSSVGLKFGKNK